jgi:hypothetical protein
MEWLIRKLAQKHGYTRQGVSEADFHFGVHDLLVDNRIT